MSALKPISRQGKRERSSSLTSGSQYGEISLHHIDFGDLPPIDHIKQAITRQTASYGISYLLPCNKTKCSVENIYRNDLRVMFQDPYRCNRNEFNERYVWKSAKHHLTPNTVPAVLSQNINDNQGCRLNAVSERVRNQYSLSAPPRGITGKQSTVDSLELRPRSMLHLPVKAKLPPEAQRLKEEAEKLLNSVKEKAEAYYEAKNISTSENEHSEQTAKTKKTKAKKIRVKIGTGNEEDKVDETFGVRIKRKTKKGETFENFKRVVPNLKPDLPQAFESPYLTEDKNKYIWEWMTGDEKFNDFDYFLKVCT